MPQLKLQTFTWETNMAQSKTTADKDQPAGLIHEAGSEYKLNPDSDPIRITIGNISVSIVPGSETVSVELAPIGLDNDNLESLMDSASATYREAQELINDSSKAQAPRHG
jgi:hypothetical protein